VFSVNYGPAASLCPPRKKKKSSELEGGKWNVNIILKMADVLVPGYQTLWTNKLSALKSEYQTLVQYYPEVAAQLKQLLQVLGDIEDVARHIPAFVGESAEY
jgi:hypothetical protein